MSWGPQQTVLVTSNFLCGPSRIRKEKKKIFPLSKWSLYFQFSKSLKVSPQKVLHYNWKAPKGKERKIVETDLVSNTGHYHGLLTTRSKAPQWCHCTTIPDNKGMTDPRPRPGLCIADRRNMGKRPPPKEAVPRGRGVLSSPQPPVMVFGGKGRWQLGSVTFKTDGLDRKEFPLSF